MEAGDIMNSMDLAKSSAVTLSDKTSLFVKKFIIRPHKALVYIVHGVCEHNERYDYLTEKLLEGGYSVIRHDLRGHGKSGGEKGYVSSHRRYSDDLKEIIEKTKEESRKNKIFVIGHSMGAFISAYCSILYKNTADGQILSGIPATLLPLKDIKLLRRLPYNIFPKVKTKNSLADKVSSDKKVVENYKNDPLNLKSTTLKLSAEMFIKGPECLAENIGEYSVPCLLLHGGDDKIVTPDSSLWFYKNINSVDKKRKLYPGLYHEILNEPRRDNVIEDILKWLDERSGPEKEQGNV